MRLLSRDASGLRHLRWGREILATLEAHAAHNPDLDDHARAAIATAIRELDGLVAALSAAVKPYRDFLERERVKGRGRRRVGVLLCSDALGDVGPVERRLAASLLSSAEALARRAAARAETEQTADARSISGASASLGAFVAEARSIDEPRRQALGRALTESIEALRDGLAQIDARLRAELSLAVIESIYPELTEDSTRVADDPDPNDDASAPP